MLSSGAPRTRTLADYAITIAEDRSDLAQQWKHADEDEGRYEHGAERIRNQQPKLVVSFNFKAPYLLNEKRRY
jgi:hypothetical protein